MIANTYVVKPFGISEVKVIALKGEPGGPTQEQVNAAVEEYMDDHPEAQIPDGAVTTEKLASNAVAPYADNLVSSSYVSDSEPYLFRKTFAGVREDTEIVGGSVVWNQLCNAASVTVANGHKYFMKKGTAYSLGASTGTAITGLTSGSDMVIDLTIMFGSTVADYILSLETATAGAGVAWCKAYNPKMFSTYQPYNAGTLMSVKTSAHKMTGFNQFAESNLNSLSGITQTGDGWDGTGVNWNRSTNVEGWENVTYFPNTAYCATVEITTRESGGVRVRWEYTDGTATDGTLITANTQGRTTVVSNPAKTIKNCHLTFGSAGSGVITVHNFCINISSSRNGQYEPYTEVAYPLSSIDLRGIPTIVDGKLKYDGDIRKSDGTVERRYGIVDLGTLNWSKYTYSNIPVFYSTTDIPNLKPGTGSNAICSAYVCRGWSNLNARIDKTVEIHPTIARPYIADTSYTDAATFKAAMSGVYLVYELATPTTETADPFTNPQVCYPDGTEEYIDTRDVPIPVGHNTKYMRDLKKLLEGIPDAPSADGTYVLKATVSSSGVTYSWVAG